MERRQVIVEQVPENPSSKGNRPFLRELDAETEFGRPRIVLDLSKVRHCDDSLIHLLVYSLEKAMKRNGDIRLAAVDPSVGKMLKQSGAGRLFKIFDTTAAAVESFHELPGHGERVGDSKLEAGGGRTQDSPREEMGESDGGGQ